MLFVAESGFAVSCCGWQVLQRMLPAISRHVLPNLCAEVQEAGQYLVIFCFTVCLGIHGNRFALHQHGTDFDLSMADYVAFHAPYNKLVQKSFGRLVRLIRCVNSALSRSSERRCSVLRAGLQ